MWRKSKRKVFDEVDDVMCCVVVLYGCDVVGLLWLLWEKVGEGKRRLKEKSRKEKKRRKDKEVKIGWSMMMINKKV